MYNSFIVGVVDTGDNTSPLLVLPALIAIGVVVTVNKLIASDMELIKNLRQCTIVGVNDTGNNLSPATTTFAIIYRWCCFVCPILMFITAFDIYIESENNCRLHILLYYELKFNRNNLLQFKYIFSIKKT